MKVRKVLSKILLFIILVLPIVAIAETCDTNSISIESLVIKAQNGNVSEVTSATKNGMIVNVNLNMIEVGDSIVYKAVVKNSSDQDFNLENSYLIVDTDYFEYSITSEDDSKIINANSSKSFDIKLKYRAKVPNEAYESGKYTDKNMLAIKLSNETNNPFTADYIALYLAIFYLSVFGLLYLFIKKKKTEETVTMLLVGLLVPLSVKALCNTQITVNSIINVDNPEIKSFKFDCSTETFNYYDGMTFGEWIKSDLYKGNYSGEFEQLIRCEYVFGSDKGCAVTSSEDKYGYSNTYSRYVYTRNECVDPNSCEEINNTIYSFEISDFSYDTLEECEENVGTGKCEERNNKFYYFDKIPFESESSCQEYLALVHTPYKACILLDKIYRTTETYNVYFNSMELCEANKEDGTTCAPKTQYLYSPTYRASSYSDNITFDFLYDEFRIIFPDKEAPYHHYYEVIRPATYQCEDPLEATPHSITPNNDNTPTITRDDILNKQ